VSSTNEHIGKLDLQVLSTGLSDCHRQLRPKSSLLNSCESSFTASSVLSTYRRVCQAYIANSFNFTRRCQAPTSRSVRLSSATTSLVFIAEFSDCESCLSLPRRLFSHCDPDSSVLSTYESVKAHISNSFNVLSISLSRPNHQLRPNESSLPFSIYSFSVHGL
jgi:hypothetical protein